MKAKFLFSMFLALATVFCSMPEAMAQKGSDKVKVYERSATGRTITKTPTLAECEDITETTAATYVLLDTDRIVCATSTSNVVKITVPSNPGYEQRFWLRAEKPGANNIILQGGVVDTITSTATKFYFFDVGSETWKKYSW